MKIAHIVMMRSRSEKFIMSTIQEDNYQQLAHQVVGNSHYSWLNKKDITKNLEEAGFVIEASDTFNKAYLFVGDEKYKKITYSISLSPKEQADLLLTGYSYYLLQHHFSNAFLKYIPDISEDTMEKVHQLQQTITKYSVLKETNLEQFVGEKTEAPKIKVRKTIS